jgi:AcrR family transcriptional regulator
MLECVRKHRQEKAQESRRKLTETALSLFARNGFAGTNMRAISRGAGMADGLVYHYFPGGKQELLQEIVRERVGVIENSTREWNVELLLLPLEDALDRVFTAALRVVEENETLFRLMIREDGIREIMEFGRFYEMLLGKQEWLVAMLELMVERGELRPMDCRQGADILFALITNYFLGRLIGLESDYYYTEEYCRKMLRYQCAMWRTDNGAVNAAEGGEVQA